MSRAFVQVLLPNHVYDRKAKMRQPIFFGIVFIFYGICLTQAENNLGLSDEEVAKLKEFKELCITESEVEREFVEEAEKGVVIMDENLACFAACMMKKIGVMREDGTIDIEFGITKIPPKVNKERATEVFRDCAAFESNNHCVKAGMISKCFMDRKDYVLNGK